VPEWRVVILRPAKRYLERLTDDERQRIFAALIELQRDPYHGPMQPLRGRPEWRLRVGGRRVLIRVDREQRALIVTYVGPRGDVYK
jgi:mRNA interferase RelE/StbE